MQFENPRAQRVADQIQRELAMLLQREVKDPRIGMVTITAVSVSREFDHANVYFTVLSPTRRSHSDADEHDSDHLDTEKTGEEDLVDPQKVMQQQTLEGLQKAAGFLRRELSRRLKLRTTPCLHFVYDKSMLEGNRLASLIEMANRDSNAGPTTELTSEINETPDSSALE